MSKTAKFTKDKSKGAVDIAAHPEKLNGLTRDELRSLVDSFNEYNPKTVGGKATKELALGMINGAIAKLPVNSDHKISDGLDKASMVENKTAVLEIEVPQPGFNKCISSKDFIARERGDVVETIDQTSIGENGVDYKRHTVVQKLFDKQYLNPLASQRAEFFAWLIRHSVPSSFLKNGHYLVPRGLINTVISKIEEMKVERGGLLDEFQTRYPEAKKDAKKRLGVHYDDSRYPKFDAIREKFYVISRWRDINPAAALREINRDEYQRQREQGKADWENTFDEIRFALRAGFVDLNASFAEAMGNDEDGKPKVFHSTKVQHLKDFLATFEARDLTNDVELAELAAQAKELISSVDPKALRKDQSMRQALQSSFNEIKEKASKLVVTRQRKIELQD